MIKNAEHGVQHDDDLHPVALAADVEEGRNVVKNDRHLLENLKRRLKTTFTNDVFDVRNNHLFKTILKTYF
jgi:hypothetical protein